MARKLIRALAGAAPAALLGAALSVGLLPPASAASAAAPASGWAVCSTPIQWVADMRLLTPRQAARETQRIAWALGEWSRATGLQFSYAGQVAAAMDPSSPNPRLADGGRLPERSILITYTTEQAAPMLSQKVYAYASASLIYPDRGEIVGGYAVVRADLPAVAGKAAAKRMRNLYLHELGHVLGLSHDSSKSSIMFPIITNTVSLSPRDAQLAESLDRPCASA